MGKITIHWENPVLNQAVFSAEKAMEATREDTKGADFLVKVGKWVIFQVAWPSCYPPKVGIMYPLVN